jgi:signal transduction histidine kinase
MPAISSPLLKQSTAKAGFYDIPLEALILRFVGIVYLAFFVLVTLTTRPAPALHGRGAAVLVALIVFAASALAVQPRAARTGDRWRIAALLAITGASAALAVAQPKGIWPAGPYYVGIMAALRLERRTAFALLALSVSLPLAIGSVEGDSGGALSSAIGAVPWFLMMRLMRRMREQRDQLAASRAAEARAAAAAERGRIAREMHDVLAHSLSALALQLESARLLARDRATDEEVCRALDRAHHLAASGLQEARRAIAAARGEQLPGPERLKLLAEAFAEQSGVPVSFAISGQPRELASDTRLAIYRTAQEALTNIRRHAAAARVELRLEYGRRQTVLVVQDYAPAGTPPPVPVAVGGSGYGLTGMRERAELLGGSLSAGPTGDGFRVELRLPA